MALPDKYKQYMSEEDWEGLALHHLRPTFRQSALSVLDTGLENTDPQDKEDVDLVLGLVQDYADDLRDASKLDWEGLDEVEVGAAEQMADYVGELDEHGEIRDEASRRDQETPRTPQGEEE
jgi:hypothetical protein